MSDSKVLILIRVFMLCFLIHVPFLSDSPTIKMSQFPVHYIQVDPPYPETDRHEEAPDEPIVARHSVSGNSATEYVSTATE